MGGGGWVREGRGETETQRTERELRGRRNERGRKRDRLKEEGGERERGRERGTERELRDRGDRDRVDSINNRLRALDTNGA